MNGCGRTTDCAWCLGKFASVPLCSCAAVADGRTTVVTSCS